MTTDNFGYLEIIIGPMFSGKTTYLVNLYKQYNAEKKSVVAINYVDDKRYHDKMLSTHDLVTIPCIFTKNIGDVLNDNSNEHNAILSADVVLINEGQFFPDLFETVSTMVEKYGKIVHICGLDGDFKRQRFGSLLDLIPLCDKIVKLSANCNVCKNPALFSHRMTTETSQIVIGSDNYVPLCRSCYIAETK